MAEDIVVIGQALIRQKERLPHGMFLPWIAADFEMGEHSARRFMQVAEVYADKSSTVRDLPPTALYALAAPSTPQEVRSEVEALLVDGQKVTLEDPSQLPICSPSVPPVACDLPSEASIFV